MIISARQVNAWVGQQVYHEDVAYPTNTLIPENGDPAKYENLPESFSCPSCKKLVLLGNPENLDNTGNAEFTCPDCNSRFSHKVLDKSWSHYATTPGLLDIGMGGNTNNEQMGVNYHPGANSNQDTFSSNLGK